MRGNENGCVKIKINRRKSKEHANEPRPPLAAIFIFGRLFLAENADYQSKPEKQNGNSCQW